MSPEMQARGQALLERLQEGAAISVVAYGDSITDAWGTDGTHVYHRLFADALAYRFPDAQIVTHVSGNPGWTTEDALRSYDRRLDGLAPDLMLVQFGGNDRGWGRPLRFIRRDLATLLTRAATETDALVIACLPPWAEEIHDGEWAFASREAAAEAGVPAADFHRAIREAPHDFRGSFPYGSHPSSYSHVVMAKELLRVFDSSTAAPVLLECEIQRGAAPLGEMSYAFSATVAAGTAEPVGFDARIEFGRESRDTEGIAAAEAPVAISEQFPVPEGLPAGRSYTIPVRLWTRAEGAGSFDVGWLAVAPALTAGPEAKWQALGADSVVLGKHLWQGEADLSARFRARAFRDTLRFDVEVADDQVSVGDLFDPSRGDCVEVYLDLRPDGEQGRPIYSEDVLALQVIPPARPGGQMQWRNMHPLPADLADLSVNAHLSVGGYRVTVELPLAAVEARRGADWGGIGLDVGVNDADHGTRKVQMMWAGTAENYLSPACLGGLYPGQVADGARRMIVQ